MVGHRPQTWPFFAIMETFRIRLRTANLIRIHNKFTTRYVVIICWVDYCIAERGAFPGLYGAAIKDRTILKH